MTTVTPAQPTFFWAPAKISPNYTVQGRHNKMNWFNLWEKLLHLVWGKLITKLNWLFSPKSNAFILCTVATLGRLKHNSSASAFLSSPWIHPQVGKESWRTCHWRGRPRLSQVWSCTPRHGPSHYSNSKHRKLRGSGSNCWSQGFLEGSITEHNWNTFYISNYNLHPNISSTGMNPSETQPRGKGCSHTRVFYWQSPLLFIT